MRLIYTVMVLLMIFLNSCFKDDEKVEPHEKGDAETVKFDSSMYNYQIFFDLDSSKITSLIPNDSWTIAFESSANGWKINVNSAFFYGVYPTGETDFNNVVMVTSPDKYIFDASSGHPDSTAFGKWLDRSAIPYLPTGEIFLIGKYNGVNYDPEWMVKFISFTDTSYVLSFAASGGIPVERQILKNPALNKVYYNFRNGGSQPDIEPAKDSWDLLFSQYGTILFTEEGVPTPYFVRGVLINPNRVEVAKDSLSAYPDLLYEYAESLQFSLRTDVIGHDWKDVEIDFNSGTAVYITRSYINYIIKDTRGFLYKLRFIDFYNIFGKEGYPSFEIQKL